ncbi:MAG: HD domain-containing protein [Candidatus Omnitrophica bacterium]|nr:HD domain-containing protein [Candidatus Omnitrophota bacterium]
MEKIFIKDLKVKNVVKTYFMITKKTQKLTKYDKPYLEVTLMDSSGKIEGRVWDNAETIGNKVDSGDVVMVTAQVEEFREEKQLKIDNIEKMEEKDFNYEDLIKVAEGLEEIEKNIKRSLSEIKDPWIKKLADEFLDDETFMKAFRNAAGAKSWHNAYIGGLMEHTNEVMQIVLKVAELYPDADRDLLIFGSFMHDIGKIYELDSKKMDYTVEGRLIGHISIGCRMLNDKIASIKDFPNELSIHIQHIILSHHGEYEQQSPVLPLTLEANVIYQADDLVSQANAVNGIISSQSDGSKEWSNYVSIKNRKYLLRKQKDVTPL